MGTLIELLSQAVFANGSRALKNNPNSITIQYDLFISVLSLPPFHFPPNHVRFHYVQSSNYVSIEVILQLSERKLYHTTVFFIVRYPFPRQELLFSTSIQN